MYLRLWCEYCLMKSLILSFVFLLPCNHFHASSATCVSGNGTYRTGGPQPDTLAAYQVLYNGREWKNLYYRVEGDQFLFSGEFLPASVAIQGRTFDNIRLRYDLYQDEVLMPFGPGRVLQLNKEMVERFAITFQGKNHHFIRMPEDGPEGLKGYVQVLYDGKSALYVKYIKKIDRPSVENKPDVFYLITRLYFEKDGQVRLIARKGDLFNALKERKTLIREFMKENSVRPSVKDPESFLPVIGFYDSLNL